MFKIAQKRPTAIIFQSQHLSETLNEQQYRDFRFQLFGTKVNEEKVIKNEQTDENRAQATKYLLEKINQQQQELVRKQVEIDRLKEITFIPKKLNNTLSKSGIQYVEYLEHRRPVENDEELLRIARFLNADLELSK